MIFKMIYVIMWCVVILLFSCFII